MEESKPESDQIQRDEGIAERHLGVYIRATVAETYCTKEDSRQIKQDIDKRIGDLWKVVLYIVIPIVLAILALVAAILVNGSG